MPNKIMPITSEEMRALEEIYADRDGLERTMKIGLAYYQNSMADLRKREKRLWDGLVEKFNLDVPTKSYKIDRVDGIHQVVESKQEDE